MQPPIIFTIILGLFVFPSLSSALEAGGQRGLQVGPLGEGTAFVTLGRADVEVLTRLIQISGDERYGERGRAVEGGSNVVAVGTGYAVNPELNFSIQLAHTQTKITGDSYEVFIAKSEIEKTMTELTAGPSLWFGDILLGAHASVRSHGKTKSRDGDTLSTTDSASIPRLKLFGGIRSGSLTGSARILLYNDARTQTTVTSPTEGTVRTNSKVRDAAETSLDGRLQMSPQFAFSGSLTFVDAERASDDRDRRDYFIYSLGGIHVASDWLTLVGGLRYTDPHFKDDEDASILMDNLGGLRIDIGTHYRLHSSNLTFGLGYTVPELVTYTNSQTFEKVKIERSELDLALGLIVNL